MFKLGSRLLHGEDIRDHVPLMPIEAWARERMHAGYWLMNRVFERPTPVVSPLDYPDSSDEFYGYTRRTVRREDGVQVPSTRNLIRVTGWLATALLAWQADQYVARKRDCHRLYREHIGGEWAGLLEDIYTRCRGEWQYKIPTARAGRQALRLLCERTLSFENYFLANYRDFVAAELTSGSEANTRHTLWVLEKLPFATSTVGPK